MVERSTIESDDNGEKNTQRSSSSLYMHMVTPAENQNTQLKNVLR